MEPLPQNSSFEEWSARIDHLAKSPNVYMKLSGVFSEMPPVQDKTPTSNSMNQGAVQVIKERVEPWCNHVIKAFGPERVMFGSDWPVCSINGGSNAWPYWKSVLQEILIETLGIDALETVFHGTAARAYKISA